MNFTSYQVQQYVRIALYWLFGALGTYGVAVPDNSKALIVSVIGTVANFGLDWIPADLALPVRAALLVAGVVLTGTAAMIRPGTGCAPSQSEMTAAA